MMTRSVGYAYCIVLVGKYTCSTFANATNKSHDQSIFLIHTEYMSLTTDDDEADENFSDSTANIKEVPNLIKLYVFFLLTFQSTLHISDAAILVRLAFLSTFFGIVARNYNVDPTLQLLFEQISNSIKAAQNLLMVTEIILRCCPSCFSTCPLEARYLKSLPTTVYSH